ncbi:MAG: hypothetical protein P4L46_21765 [Fimbriimonas sp.]|nr:hypothetical protein [Fimbriimonas sp.]
MTVPERVSAAVKMSEVDRCPTLVWLAQDSDAEISVVSELGGAVSDGRLVIVDIANPFGLALGKGLDLNKAMKDDPSVGALVLDGLVDEVRGRIRASLDSGADGIFYRLHGASPRHCTPMEYGGYYLERDRELLTEVAGAAFNVVFVAGREDLYVDFVSDLPAQVFAWDAELSRLDASDVRKVRRGAVASSDPTSDFLLTIGKPNYLETLEQPSQEQPNIG